MRPSELRALTVAAVRERLLPFGWKWRAKSREFRRPTARGWHSVTLADILHWDDVDFEIYFRIRIDLLEREITARASPELGEEVLRHSAMLGNNVRYWYGHTGRRYTVADPRDVPAVADRIAADVMTEAVALLERFSDLRAVFKIIGGNLRETGAWGLVGNDAHRGALAVTLAHAYGDPLAMRATYRAHMESIPLQGPWHLVSFQRYLDETNGGLAVAATLSKAGLIP